MSDDTRIKLEKLLENAPNAPSHCAVTLSVSRIPGPDNKECVAIYLYDGQEWRFFPFSDRESLNHVVMSIQRAADDVFGPEVKN